MTVAATPPPVDGHGRCVKCEGEGQIANSDDGEPWSMWENLPTVSKLAVHLGVIFPIECPVCAGTGEQVPAGDAAKVTEDQAAPDGGEQDGENLAG